MGIYYGTKPEINSYIIAQVYKWSIKKGLLINRNILFEFSRPKKRKCRYMRRIIRVHFIRYFIIRVEFDHYSEFKGIRSNSVWVGLESAINSPYQEHFSFTTYSRYIIY